ncbi:MAG: hypothetical protein QXL02_02255 [Candidatus Anstonellales archaeon]
MIGAIFTYDLAIAAIMIALIAILVFSNFTSDSYSNDLLVMHDLAKDIARLYSQTGTCPDNMIPSIYSYRIYLNSDQKCSRGNLGDVAISISIPIAEQRKEMVSEESPYFYKTCQNRDRDGNPIYRCSVYSDTSLDDLLNNYKDYMDIGYLRVVISR